MDFLQNKSLNNMPSLKEFLETLPGNFISIFVFILIISGNYLGELFPCEVQKLFSDNMFAKHILGFLTLMFFVTTTLPEFKEYNIVLFTSSLYLFFLFMAKMESGIWLFTFGCVGIIYVLHSYQKTLLPEENKESFEGEKQENKVDKKQDLYNYLDSTKFILSILVVITTFIGTLSYMGEKKIEYGKKFTYSRFFFGVPNCRGKSPPNMGYLHNIMAAFK
tara:strand:+ start:938 stop:1597 length:660 start_codon:yes stop_codon:yes gene_type:complete